LADGAPLYAREIPNFADGPPPAEGFSAQPIVPHPALDGLGFADLRANMAALDAAEAATAAAAKGILGWHETHRYCANCGSASEPADAGWRRACPACRAQHFPRTDPVVIMLVLSGSSVLLGRSAAWPPGMYSLLAGFMEPGESIEAAVRREVFEEAGVPVGQVDYLSSQPWPFPSSLMIGCRGLALSRDIRRDPAELEDARWVSREGVLAALAGHDPDLKPARRGSIARFLLERWLADALD
jgi:NAD+ diphosphatase